MRTMKSLFKLKTQNVLLLGTMVLSLVLTAAVIFIPALSAVFGFETINFAEYAVALGLAVSIIPLAEIYKLIKKTIKK